MKKIFEVPTCKFPFLFLLLPLFLNAQNNFDIHKIPVALQTNADAVIRMEETVYSIENAGHATQRNKIIVSIFNERGEEMHAGFRVSYDKLSKIRNISGIRYDAAGAVIEKLKSNDVKDIGISSFGNDVMDNRIKVAGFTKKQTIFPYTVEYNWETETSNMMFYPVWNPCDNEYTSLEKSIFMVNAPVDLPFRYKEINLPAPVQITQQENNRTYTWHLENFPAYEREPYAPPFDQPSVITAPINFEVEGYKGSIHTWADISKFYFELNKGRDALPASVKAKVKSLIQNETDIKVKIKKLYEYLQENTHYMNISLGIGGWQTLLATEVAAKGYGDCKALSNFMKALLQEAGITAYQALVYAGDNSLYSYPDFPSMHFNHVITCVPLEKDTVFLECTSQTNPFGYQGSFTGNRKALLIQPNEGQLINTASYTPAHNTQIRKGKIVIAETGNAEASVSTVYSGIQQEDRYALMHTMDKENQKEWITDHISIPSFDLQEFSFIANKKKLPTVEEKLKLIIKKLVVQSGTRLFMTPNLMTGFLKTPLTDKERMSDLYLNPNDFNFQDIDTITYELPLSYVLEFTPEPVKINSKFGEYTAHSIVKEHTLIYYRSVTVTGGAFPKTDFKEWADFIKKISKSDRATVVFTLKTDREK